MPLINREGIEFWIPSMSPKGTRVYLDHRRQTLLHGSRKSTKSNTCQNICINHAFQFDAAKVGIIVKGLARSDCWEDMMGANGLVMKEWIPSGTTSWVVPPSHQSDTKIRFAHIKNRHGGSSEIQLHTLLRPQDVDKFKDSRFSMLYMVEADRWDDPKVLKQMSAQLRSRSVPHEARVILLDCNPPRKGVKHWLHGEFLKNEKGEYPPDIDPDLMEINFTVDDNPFISQAEKDGIRKDNSYDEVELQRNYHGKWVASSKDTAFYQQYVRNIHVRGDVSSPYKNQHTVLLPPPGAFEFTSGWDLGDATNHAAVIACKIFRPDGMPVIYVIDEIVRTGQNYSIKEFGEEFMDRVRLWERVMKTRNSPKLQFRFWSDSSNLRYSSHSDGSAASQLATQSNGFILLQGVTKASGSVKRRIQLLKRALYLGPNGDQAQLFISASCHHTIRMIEELEVDENEDVDPHDPHKHVLDSLTYLLTYELPVFEQSKSTVGRIVTI